ncbi:hypothetical protein E2C01_090857 [Portunus trituberculatus]|uniref:Uncharacterized protein n=1 Tax=Portunus trituberculatus TaxID=210409 RepID=A0A5B7JRH4_PORTR|nr:hypothetical protein [Portunus trituberculatus]
MQRGEKTAHARKQIKAMSRGAVVVVTEGLSRAGPAVLCCQRHRSGSGGLSCLVQRVAPVTVLGDACMSFPYTRPSVGVLKECITVLPLRLIS